MAYKVALKVNNKMFKFKGENFKELYTSIVSKAKGIKKQHPSWKVNVISLTIPFRVPNKPSPHKAGVYWCPYCRSWQRYEWDEYMGLWICPICGISTRDYHVRQSNGGTENVPW